MLFDGVDGIKVYDPRKDEKVISGNPALVLGYIVTEYTGAIVGDGFWPGIQKLADFCDDRWGKGKADPIGDVLQAKEIAERNRGVQDENTEDHDQD